MMMVMMVVMTSALSSEAGNTDTICRPCRYASKSLGAHSKANVLAVALPFISHDFYHTIASCWQRRYVTHFHGSRDCETQFIVLQNVFGIIQVKIGIGCQGNSET